MAKAINSEEDSEAEDDFLETAIGSLQKLPPVVKLDVDNQSTITYLTESSRLTNGPPSTVLSSQCDTN